MQQIVARQKIDEQVIDYAVRLVRATANGPASRWVAARGERLRWSAARAPLQLHRGVFVIPDDIKKIACQHTAPCCTLSGSHARGPQAE